MIKWWKRINEEDPSGATSCLALAVIGYLLTGLMVGGFMIVELIWPHVL